MKTIKSALTVLFFITVSAAYAQVGKSYKAQNISSSGHILSDKGDTLGLVTPDGLIKTMKGQKIGFIEPDGTVTDKDGKRLGKAEKNGNYYNINGVLMISVKDTQHPECEVIDQKGQKLGDCHRNYKMSACAISCFNYEEPTDHKKK